MSRYCCEIVNAHGNSGRKLFFTGILASETPFVFFLGFHFVIALTNEEKSLLVETFPRVDTAVALSPKTLILKLFHCIKPLQSFSVLCNASYPSDVGG